MATPAQPQQYPPGVLLDAMGNPMAPSVPTSLWQRQAAPDGAYLPDGYGPTTIIIESGGGQVELTEDDHLRMISYADIYASQVAVGTVVNKLVRQISTIPLKVYERPQHSASQNGKPKHPEEIVDSDDSLVSLLHHPAPGYGAVSLKEWISMPLFVHGGSVIAKFRGNGYGEVPTQIIPLDWRYLQAWARIGTPVLLWASMQTGVMKWIAPSEVVYTAWTSPAGSNGAWLCTSPLQQLGTTVAIDEAAQRYAKAHFKHAARPGLIITLPPTANVQQNSAMVDRMQEKADENYAGVGNAWKTMVLGGGAEAKPFGQTAEEAQLTATRAWDWSEIRDLYDLPPASDTNNPEADAQLYKTTLRVHFEMIADRLNAQLVYPEPEWRNARKFIRADMSEVLWGDPLVLSDKMVAEVIAELRTVDEARVALGLQPRGGDADKLPSELTDPANPSATGDPAAGPGGAPAQTPQQIAMAEARSISAINKV
jgi:HK97 family phage portal protein